jgi:hypothetical protein
VKNKTNKHKEIKMKTKKITFTNPFHNTTVTVNAKITKEDEKYRRLELSKYQAKKIKKTLCGMDDCNCGGAGTDFEQKLDGSLFKWDRK